jgi:PAS domain S-box-containing protein
VTAAVSFILIASLVLQIVAVYFALRLIKVTGKSMAWSLIATAITLMALRRGISLIALFESEHAKQPDLYAELIGLAISVLMAVGIQRITPIFKELRSINDRLRESEEKYRQLTRFQRTILDNVAYGIISTTPDGTITSFNPAAERLLGYTADELVGKQTPALWHDPDEMARRALRLSEDLGETILPGFDVFATHPRRNLPEEHEWTFIRKDRVHVSVNLSVTALRDESGQITGFVGLTYDLSERKQTELRLLASEQEFRALAENSPDVIVRYDRKGRRIYVNPEFERVNHLTAQQVLGKTPAELSTTLKPKADVFTEKLMAAMASGTVAKIDLSWTQEGKPVCWFVRVVPEFDENRKVTSALTIWSDISERKQAEEELRLYKDQLEATVQQRTAELLLARDAAEAANKAKSVFLANMSHELRTPLNAIMGFSGLMRRDPRLSDKQIENLDIINRSGEHLLTLINDVLEVAKIEAGHLHLDIAPFDLGGLMRDVTEMMQIRAQEKGLRLLLDQSSEFPRYIKSDEARIRQILINLINNALKFTEQGGVTVRLGVKDNARHHLLIEVEDSGPGIAPEDQTRLFEPFVQLTEGAAQRGTGLGLTITRQFVQMMGGGIAVESTLGKGSLFRVDLPVERVRTTDILPEALKKGDVKGLAPGQPHYKILIVEDQYENQLLLSRLMSEIGMEVKVAENGQQGLEQFQDWHPDLIWMDRRMPVMDGEEATRRIRQLPEGQTVKIVAVTASAFKEEQQVMLDAGMDDFVRKPYRFEEIYDCLARHLGVEYVYHGEAPTDASPPATLDAAMLAALPAALRQELRAALENLDSERIAVVIGQIDGLDATLGLALSRLADYFDYPGILKWLDAADGKRYE